MWPFNKKRKDNTEKSAKSVIQPIAQTKEAKQSLFMCGTPERRRSPLDKACDSDDFLKVSEEIGTGSVKFQDVVDRLKHEGKINLLLKILAMPMGLQQLMNELMEIDDTPVTRAEINRLGKDGVAPIHLYAEAQELALFIRLIANDGADLDLKDAQGRTPLLLACELGNVAGLKTLINNGARAFDVVDSKGWSPLHFACQIANPKIVQLLIENGAQVNPISNDGFMPIHIAISSCMASRHSSISPTGAPWSHQDALLCINILVNNGADLNFRCSRGFAAKDLLTINKQ